ncbi:MAG: MCP four helix bundle domain-containing protein [Candidatus Omnitrophica bacterium]|nr:MCP four helix bundle domain-containing protein [Candidatus Omnitrophota bacterium]MBU4478081.1 MCP four helix bundle domain-containing protein [Candidatus Omnitrophota bacterium]
MNLKNLKTIKFSFSHRIFGGFLIMALLSILVGYLAFITTNNLQKVSRAIMRENVSSLKAAEELELAIVNQKGLVASYFLDNNHVWLKTLEEKRKDFAFWFEKAQEVALTDNEKMILKDIFLLYKNYDNQRNRAIKLYQAGRAADGKKILLNDMKDSMNSLYQKCEDLILANEVLIAKAEIVSQDNVLTMTRFIWTIIIITLCLGAFLGFFMSRKINEQLVRSAKMASLGQLSANIAHEIRNPLTSIKMRLYSLGEELRSNPAAKDDIGVITEEINRMEKTVKNFLDFARPPELVLQKCDVNKVLEGTINLVFAKANSQGVQIKKTFEAPPLEFAADKEQLRQVFLNIILNAIEAMPAGGTLEIGITKDADREFKDALKITFKDSGTGMPADYRQRLFEPFFTTKTEGTGLGLFISSRIIHLHKGKIEVDSYPGRGTTVTVTLPLC